MDWEWAYAGVNTTVPRNAGPECADFLNRSWRYVDTFFVLLLTWQLFKWGWARIHLPMAAGYVRRDRGGRRTLLVLMSVVWGMEIGYKFSSRTVIYLLNPCHVTTAIQIYLLAASPSRAVTAVFRFHLNLLNGPLLAFLFPETDTRLLPLESAIYWIQHGMMFVVPYYLLRLGANTSEPEPHDLPGPDGPLRRTDVQGVRCGAPGHTVSQPVQALLRSVRLLPHQVQAHQGEEDVMLRSVHSQLQRRYSVGVEEEVAWTRGVVVR
nr:unnamed protein product [Callosobruchus chinensis]